jgi:hypothetical protein
MLHIGAVYIWWIQYSYVHNLKTKDKISDMDMMKTNRKKTILKNPYLLIVEEGEEEWGLGPPTPVPLGGCWCPTPVDLPGLLCWASLFSGFDWWWNIYNNGLKPFTLNSPTTPRSDQAMINIPNSRPTKPQFLRQRSSEGLVIRSSGVHPIESGSCVMKWNGDREVIVRRTHGEHEDGGFCA